MGLLENLHEAGVLLRVDQVDVRVHVIVLQRLQSVAFFFVVRILLFALLLVQVSFGVERVALDLHRPLLVELDEFLLVVKDFLEEFLPASSATMFLAAAHLLLKSVESAGFFLRLREHFGASVKVAVDKLSFK